MICLLRRGVQVLSGPGGRQPTFTCAGIPSDTYGTSPFTKTMLIVARVLYSKSIVTAGGFH